MWIRSQNRQMLLECRGVRIVDCCSIDICRYEIYGYGMSFETKQYLGAYSNKEKALKVLDMIENAIGGVPETDIKGNVIGIAIKKIFQMPQDDEV